MVKELRERTQAGMADCKNALVEADGDLDKAVEVILKKGIVKAAAREGRIATEGEVRTVVSADGKRGTIVEINCQTDFVARGDTFKDFAKAVTEVASTLPKGADLLGQKYPGDSRTIDEVRQEVTSKTGEKTAVRRWDVLEAKDSGGIVHAYIHAGGKLAVLVHADAPSTAARNDAAFTGFVDNVAMQIAAMNPMVVRKEDVSDAQVAKQREIFDAQMKEEPKQPPAAAWQKILDGKINKWFTEVTLLGQENVWAPGEGTIEKIRLELGKKVGGEVKIVSFVRFGLGEGIEKKTDDLAAEVAKMTGG
jgi:elongation factor Ts